MRWTSNRERFSPVIAGVIHNMFENEVINMLSKETGLPVSQINLNSTLLGDLGIDGDDAWAIFEYCHEKYGLDLSAFDFNEYFRNEPCTKGLVYLYRKLKYKDEHVASKKAPIKVSKLIEACTTGVWGNHV